ncbi:hypothetical protein V2J09_008565 [Rumex salicifolius]
MAYSQHQYRSPFGDTTLTKVFVGGLAWETPTEKMRDYFHQFGEILEAVIITDKYTGHSKGYGFVTFREPESASRACANPNPMIDGRRTNCNIASQGRPRTAPPRGRGDQGGPTLLSSTSSQFGEMQNSVQAMPHNPFVYPSYGYPPYTSGFGYHHGMYHPQQYQQQLQQQYYAQQLYGSSASSSLPYHYSYSMPSSRGMTISTSQHRMPPYYYYYSPEQTSNSPNYTTNGVSVGGSSFPSNNPPLLSTPPATRQQTPSTSSDSQAQPHRATKETEVVVATSKESSST